MTRAPLGLYVDADGRQISTHSMLKTMSRCPKQTQYKYVERLKKRVLTERDKPLRRGTWFHELLELYYVGADWKAHHRKLTAKYSMLMDEEKDALGNLPDECLAMMRGYLWHYGANRDDPYHGWTVHDTELTLECDWPDGSGVYRCRLDVLVEDEYGLWVVDHKTHKTLPGMNVRLLDHASALYIWAARENGIDVKGFIWNYIRTKAPTKPQLVYANDPKRRRLSTKAIDTDYPTMVRAIREYELDPKDYKQQLLFLRGQRWQPGITQTSPFFRREVLEKDDRMLARVVAASMHTRDRAHGYHWDAPDEVERVSNRSCTFECDYVGLCETELLGGDGNRLRRQLYRIGDPLDYYNEQKGPE